MAAFEVSDILSATGGRLVNGADLGEAVRAIRLEGMAPLAASGPRDVAFFFSRNYQDELPRANPGVLITAEPFVKPLEAAKLPIWKTAAIVSCEDPYLAMALLSGKFAGALSSVAHSDDRRNRATEVHPTAIVHGSAEIGPGASIGPYCVVEEGAKIGAGTRLYPGCFIGPGALIGENCVLFPRVTLYEWTRIGSRVRIHAGVTLGADGFGYAPKREGKKVVGHQKIYHLGRVVIEDDVEIGANACVDRGTFGDTRIGREAKLDNDVHVGHNAVIEEGAVICGGTALAGNARVGKFAYVGGLTGITNQVYVGDAANVGACALVTKDVPPGGTAVGNPQREYREHFKAHALLNRLLEERSKKG